MRSNTRVRLTVLCVLGILIAVPAASQNDEASAPLSAIEWLTPLPGQTVLTEPLETPTTNNAPVPSVDVAPLGRSKIRSVGLIDAETLLYAPDFWSGFDPAALVPGPAAPLPEVGRIRARMLMTRAPSDDATLVGRLRTLVALGNLEAAFAMVQSLATEDATYFDIAKDISLLSSRDQAVCRNWADARHLDPDPGLRVLCLSQIGRWDAAATVFVIHDTLGDFDTRDADLLAMHLEPELAESEPAPEFQATEITPLRFRLLESAGFARGTQDLPLGFAFAQLRESAGWKPRLDAAERLLLAGSIPPNQMLGLYTENRPSASGGVWERVRTVQRLRRGFLDGTLTMADVTAAWIAADAAGLAGPIAKMFEDRWSVDAIDGAPGPAFIRFALLAGQGKLVDDGGLIWENAPVGDIPQDLRTAVRDGLSHQPTRQATATDMATVLNHTYRAEEGDLTALTRAMRLLVETGRRHVAERVAIEYMVLTAGILDE